MLPCLIFEDEDLLVVNKPAGLNTHAPGPHAGEGIYDWLRHREPRWASLAIIHRLDKETSGVLVFSKTAQANRSLTGQFTRRAVRKRYLLLTDRPVRQKEITVKSELVRSGGRYIPRPVQVGEEPAETRFRVVNSGTDRTLLEAEPVTGRTHQIRAQAAAEGFPVLGDTLYGGTPAGRVHLHAQEITLEHPATGAQETFRAATDFSADTRLVLRSALLDAGEDDSYRLIHGASDGRPGWYVDRLGDFLLSQSERDLNEAQRARLAELMGLFSLQGVCHKILTRQVRRTIPLAASPRPALGAVAPEEVVIRENGLRFALRFQEGYSVGLFLDQRENRRRFLTGHVAAGFSLDCHDEGQRRASNENQGSSGVSSARSGSGASASGALAGLEILNTFAYTCGFSVCAARAGARTTSLDLSRKYLDWGRRNFELNGLDLAAHDLIYGEVFDWLHRFAKRGRRFDVVVLDPPTFSQSKEAGGFQAEKDYGRLVEAALPVLNPGGVLFASTNAARLAPQLFLGRITSAVVAANRRVVQQHYVPQPPDFPVSRDEPAYLKTAWLRVG